MKYTFLIPAIVCDGCVTTLTTVLTPFTKNNDTKFISISETTKKATITTNSDVTSATILEAIIDAGYDNPAPTLVPERSSVKRNQDFAQVTIDKIDEPIPNLDEDVSEGPAITHQFKIITARGDKCLENLTEQFSNLHLNAVYNAEQKTLSVTTSEHVSALEKIIAKTGHKSALLNPLNGEEQVSEPRKTSKKTL